MFIATKDGHLAVSRIISYRDSGNLSRKVIAYDDGAGIATTTCEDVLLTRALAKWPVQILPAPSGTYVVRAGFGAEGEWDDKTFVFGLALCADGYVYPVTADGINDGCDDEFLAILQPDGKVVQPLMQTFNVFEDWRANALTQAREDYEESLKPKNIICELKRDGTYQVRVHDGRGTAMPMESEKDGLAPEEAVACAADLQRRLDVRVRWMNYVGKVIEPPAGAGAAS